MAHERLNDKLRNQNALKMSADVGAVNDSEGRLSVGTCDPFDMAVNWFDSWSSSVFVVSVGSGDSCL